jgi:hypothetical protein
MPSWVRLALKVVLNWLLRELQEELEQGIVVTYKGYRIRIQLEKTHSRISDETYILVL